MLRCTTCQEEKPKTEFHRNKSYTRGYQYICKYCTKEYNKQPKMKANRERITKKYRNTVRYRETIRKSNLRRRYGKVVDVPEVCDVCGEKNPDGRNIHVDHCHNTGKIRGFLCYKCNTSIGFMRDDFKLIKALAKYLEERS